jgi:outer membrane protein assembly factor BamD
MKFAFKLTILIFLIATQSCSKKEKEISVIEQVDQRLEMISTYREGFKSLEDGDPYLAARKFVEAEMLYPQSIWAPKSAIMASYSYYLQDYYIEAIASLEKYLETYPIDDNRIYAHYLIATSHFQMIEDEKKDIEPLLKAKEKYKFVITEFPNTDFALDSKFKLELINHILASKEMYIGRHYIYKKKWIAAINRFKAILNSYETTIYAEEAIHRLVEIHHHIGLEEESKKYAELLGYNYLSGEWYKKSYKIFNKDYKERKIDKKETKKSIITKFKKLF